MEEIELLQSILPDPQVIKIDEYDSNLLHITLSSSHNDSVRSLIDIRLDTLQVTVISPRLSDGVITAITSELNTLLQEGGLMSIGMEMQNIIDQATEHIPAAKHPSTPLNTPPLTEEVAESGYVPPTYIEERCYLKTEPYVVQKSKFYAHTANVDTEQDALAFIKWLVTNFKDVADSTHNISAWRTGDGESYDEDGEKAAGHKLLFLLQKMGIENRVVVVTRHFGGRLLGPSRFKRINETAQQALEMARVQDPLYRCTHK
eukprot:gnl/Dysnectes_brevis/3598_a4576_734.p1 GENE.gnl/Dysnectes_brevis/3598_a4576_734~~gnl/Dysnectes_brevis/3598_a4576_734.p1  ORF type:complete len:260 (+),score=32.09 gnl/Dysnectes_brevis/3598_a4576_734:72-851(+)